MSSTSLNNLSVNPGTGNQALLQPKLQFKFRVTFAGMAAKDADVLSLTRQVIDCNRPQVTFEATALPVYNSTVYIAGKPTWNELTINLRDDINNSISKVIGQQIGKQFDFVNQASARAGSDYKFTTFIEILDGNNGAKAPGVLEKFACYGCFIQAANYQTLNYGTNDPVQISLTIRYDNAIQLDASDAPSVGVGVDSPSIKSSTLITATSAG